MYLLYYTHVFKNIYVACIKCYINASRSIHETWQKTKKTDINFVIHLTFNIPKAALLRKFIPFSDISRVNSLYNM